MSIWVGGLSKADTLAGWAATIQAVESQMEQKGGEGANSLSAGAETSILSCCGTSAFRFSGFQAQTGPVSSTPRSQACALTKLPPWPSWVSSFRRQILGPVGLIPTEPIPILISSSISPLLVQLPWRALANPGTGQAFWRQASMWGCPVKGGAWRAGTGRSG